MLVTIVVVPNADNTGLDPDRMGRVEDIPDEVAVKMLQMGTAREPSTGELDAYRTAQTAEAGEERTADQDDSQTGGEAATPTRSQAKRSAANQTT
ncbi:hypothetical protein [Dactylosporangium sp. CA-139066]|uniref:hypothetical protein n=1 Tax=Dactylosporangium sp. CA-139066 TaxID=3239930 RepID=UPI003D8F41AB